MQMWGSKVNGQDHMTKYEIAWAKKAYLGSVNYSILDIFRSKDGMSRSQHIKMQFEAIKLLILVFWKTNWSSENLRTKGERSSIQAKTSSDTWSKVHLLSQLLLMHPAIQNFVGQSVTRTDHFDHQAKDFILKNPKNPRRKNIGISFWIFFISTAWSKFSKIFCNLRINECWPKFISWTNDVLCHIEKYISFLFNATLTLIPSYYNGRCW